MVPVAGGRAFSHRDRTCCIPVIGMILSGTYVVSRAMVRLTTFPRVKVLLRQVVVSVLPQLKHFRLTRLESLVEASSV